MSEILTSTIDSPIGPLTLIARDGVLTSLSMLEHGSITPQMTEEAIRAVTAYLGTHIPPALPKRAAGGG